MTKRLSKKKCKIMKMKTIRATTKILLINWIIAPALGIWIFHKNSFFMFALFFVIWLIADKIWDWLSGILITGTGKVGVNEATALRFKITGNVPMRVAFMMIIDLIGTLLLPWLVAGFLLNFYK